MISDFGSSISELKEHNIRNPLGHEHAISLARAAYAQEG